MKKIAISLLVLGLVFGGFATVIAQDEVEFAFDSRTDREKVFRESLEEFEGQVTFNPLPGTSEKQLNYYTTRFAANSSTPDIINMDIVWPSTFASADWVMDLNDYVDEEWKDKFFEGYIDALTVEGKLVGTPGAAGALLFYYRKDLLEKYGFDNPPETWYEMISQANVILDGEDDPNLRGITFQGANIEGLLANYLEFLWGLDGSILDENGNVIINNEKGVKALQMMKDLYSKYGVADKGVITTKTDDSRVIFQDGRAIFMLNWPYAWGRLQSEDSAVKGKVGIDTPPAFPGHDPNVCLGGYQFGVNANTENPDLAWKVVKKLSSYETRKKAALVRGDPPTMKAVYKDEEVLETNPWFEELLPILETGKSRPKSPAYPEVSSAIRNQLSAALAGNKTPQEALDAAAEDLEELPLYK
ncbi:ABC transporter substrate-binding protein [Candidatus Bipolaricaulota bacterium]|nr:ABC transporter substrate-binding protein [Candidatus Bipolaricaulota bacterium]